MRRAITIICFLIRSMFFPVFSYSSPLNQSCLQDQMSALLQLKDEQKSCAHNPFTYDDTPFESWKNDTTCCSWMGVTCDSLTGHVIGLDLTDARFCDIINSTSALFHLTHLQSLILSGNSLKGPILFGFARLSNLTLLDLSGNSFDGQIHANSCLFHLPNLITLDLSANHFEGSIPNGFDRLSNLIHLDVSWNLFHGQIHANNSLFHLRNLQKLDLSYNNFEGSILDSFDGLFNLKHLDLRWNHFSGQIHANSSLFHLHNLQTIDLSSNNFEGSIPYGFDRLFNLTHLDLSKNHFNGQIHANSILFHLPDLKMLDLSTNNFVGSIPPGFYQLSKLTYLDLSSNSFEGQIPLDISQLTELVTLDVSYNSGLKLKNPNLRTLIQSLSNLTVLRLNWVNMSSDGHDNNYDWSRSISSMLPNLEQLSLSNCSISEPLDAPLSNLHSLSKLILDSNNLSSTIADLLGKLPSLRVLSLRSTNLYGVIPRNFFGMHPDLEELYLSYNYLLSGSLPEFPEVNSLRCLHITSTPLCGNLPNSVRNLKLLEDLDFRNCSLFGSFPSILSSFENLTDLGSLDLSHNSLTGQIPSFFKDKFPYLSVLFLSDNFLQGPIPSSFANLTELQLLDLSYNNLSGQIPSFFNNKFSNLRYVSLSNNLLEGPFHSSQLSLPSLWYIDLSSNQLNGILHDDKFSHNSKLVGKIPLSSACNGRYLEVLDLSYNKLSGVISSKCFGRMIGNISFLYLEHNNLHGSIPATFTKGCHLRMLKLNRNQIEGELPKSLENCINLEELDLGNNQLSGTFPFWLQSLPQLRVLVMGSNKFYGPITQKSTIDDSPCFPMLHVFDISVNNFIGKLPLDYISQWKSMLVANISQLGNYLTVQGASDDDDDHNILEIVSKGIYLKMDRIFSTYTTINLSHNKFEGNISVIIGVLKALMELNLSANVLTGQIPASIAQLIQLESLDLSKNRLLGEIPQQMASLTSLSVLDLSENSLTGMIPQGSQFETFSPMSYEGNVGLCGFPLPKGCGPEIERASPPMALTLEKEEDYTIGLFDWRFMIAGYCSGVISGAIVGQTMSWRIIGCFKLASRMEKYKPKWQSKKIKSHGRLR